MSDILSVHIAEHVATVTIHSPTMPPEYFTALGDAFRALAGNDDVRCVVLRSDAKAFCYGLDLMKTFQAHGKLLTGANLAGPRHDLRRMITRWQDDISAIADCPHPVIAAIHSWCLGGGLDVITACDIRLCSEDAKISLRETKIAIVADLGTLQRLPRIVGQGAAREMAFRGHDVPATEAVAMGLCNRVYKDREEVQAAAAKMAAEIAANAPLTVRGTKHVMDVCADRTVAEGLGYVATYNSAFLPSEDLGEAVASFAQKRPPVFTGK